MSALSSRGPERPRRTVAWVFNWFLANDSKVTHPGAIKERKRVLGLFTEYRTAEGRHIGESYTDECIGADLVEFLNSHLEGGSLWTRKRWIAFIKRPFNQAARLGLITGCPFAGVTCSRGRRGRDLTPEEFQTLLREATPAFRRVLIFLRWSGARPSEMSKLQWSHVREAARAIVQDEHKTATTCAEFRPRRIQLNRVLLKLLAWIKRRTDSKLVFVNTYGGRWKTRALCKNIQDIKRRIGLDPRVKLYSCRHTFATGAIINGVDIATLAELMGHASTLTTGWYLHLAGKSDHLSAAAERAVSGASPKRSKGDAA